MYMRPYGRQRSSLAWRGSARLWLSRQAISISICIEWRCLTAFLGDSESEERCAYFGDYRSSVLKIQIRSSQLGRKRMRMAVSWGALWRVLLLLLLAAAVVTACFTLPVQKMLKEFLVWIDKNLGPWGPVVLAVAYIPLTVLAVPASILTLGGGYLFGLPIGFAADSIGSTVGATAAFLVGKTIGRSYVESKLKDYPQFQAVAIATQRSGFKIVLLLRLVPLLPFNVLNYLLSVTPIGVWWYTLASWIGMMPITLALVYAGTTIKDLSDVTHNWSDISPAHWILLTASLAASVVLIILVTYIARSSLNKALEESAVKVDGILVSTDSALVNEPCRDLQQPLIVTIGTNSALVGEACADVQQPLIVKVEAAIHNHNP